MLYVSFVLDDEKCVGKCVIFVSLQVDYVKFKVSWGGYIGYDCWFVQFLLNVYLGVVVSYLEWVLVFMVLYYCDGGDWVCFYVDVKVMVCELK